MGKFPLGQIVATPAALDLLDQLGELPSKFLDRHSAGDWGEMELEDRQENELSLQKGYRLFSSYDLKLGHKLWIITEADRSATTLLLPSDY